MITENQALASFDFLGTTGDSDSDEEDDEEEEEEERENEEGDPTVSVDDEFTSGFVENVRQFGPMTGKVTTQTTCTISSSRSPNCGCCFK